MARKKKFKIDVKEIVLKSVTVGIILPVVIMLSNFVFTAVEGFGFNGTEGLVMLLSGLLLVLAMYMRKGVETLPEAFASMLVIFGLWNLIGAYLNFNPLENIQVVSGFKELGVFLAYFFISEALSMKLMEKLSL